MNLRTLAMPFRSDSHVARLSVCLMVAFVVSWAVLEDVLGARLWNDYDLLQVVWCRYAVHLALLFLLLGWREPSRLWRTKRPAFQLGRSVLMFVMPFSFILAIESGVAMASVWSVFWLSPLLILALARIILREQVGLRVWLLVALGTAAAVAILGPLPSVSGGGWMMPLAMAVSFSLYVIMTRSLRTEPLAANLFYTALGVLLASSPFMPRIWSEISLHDGLVFTAIGGLGLVALAALDRALARMPVSVSVPALHLQVLFVLVFTHLGSGSFVPPLTAMAALVLISVGLSVLSVARSVDAAARGKDQVYQQAGVQVRAESS